MFRSATLKLTLWYAGSLIVICLFFSVTLYIFAIGGIKNFTGSTYLRYDEGVYTDAATNLAYVFDYQVLQAKNNILTALIIANLVIWSAGSVGSYYLARKTLRPIKASHDAQSRFTSDASHELRTPLASMKIELEVALRDGHISKNEMHEILESNLEDVNRLTDLSQTLLQLSRLEHDDITFSKLNLNENIKQSISYFKDKGRISFTQGNAPVFVSGNESNINELLTIFIDNALKYSPDNSKVIVKTLEQHNNLAGFEVTNEGKGIPKEKLNKILDRFYRLDKSRTGGKYGGHGLGLSLAKMIIENHQGYLSVRSKQNDTTTFRVLLPIEHTPVKRCLFREKLRFWRIRQK